MLTAAVLAAGCNASSSSDGSLSPTPAPTTAVITETTEVDARVIDIAVRSPSVGQVPVRLILPATFAAEPARRWPVLYLLHGCCDTYDSWDRKSDIAQLTANAPVIVALPDGGLTGYYSDWLSGPKWETFHTVELPTMLAAAYRASDKAAIAGVSMGGLGAIAYAARHPGQYAAVASLSGVTHTLISPTRAGAYQSQIRGQGEDPDALWGDPVTNVDVWRAHNPYDLAPKLKGIPIYLACGNGDPGPLDLPGVERNGNEAALELENVALAKRFSELGIPADVHLYGPGTHAWPYWQREMHQAWPMFVTALGL